ncbi:hypothetical protein HanIR_Chr15g0782261 [Helianthus annuus]|nr:hypothetical protein HanIR_Chr15g0782261 [Helianthus annuus]
MWKWKMVTGVQTSVPERIVCERAVNVEEFHTIGITHRFEEHGWEKVLDWCEDITSRVSLAAVCEWLSTLRFENSDGPAPTWQLIGNIRKNQMIMSIEHMNAIASYIARFWRYRGVRNDLSLEGRILQGISLENVMGRFGDRGKMKAPDCRVIHALLYGTPRLSSPQIVMINTWDMRESCTRKMIPYVRLISAMILQQNALPQESLWVSKPIDQFNFASIKRHWKITVKVFGHLHTVEDDQGNSYIYTDPRKAEEGGHDEEMVDEEYETEPADPWGPKKRYRRLTREISADVANVVSGF